MTTRKLVVTLETVTPMFLAGADSQKPELRPPSVRGQLRYWLRAALGAIVGDDLEALKRAESEVFGDTTGRGAVEVRAKWIVKKKPITEDALPHPSAEHSANMKGFPSGSQFQLTLIQRSNNEATWLAAIASLLLMVSIGGLGRRCRRGWGSLLIVSLECLPDNCVSTDLYNFLITRPNSPTDWRTHLQNIESEARNCSRKLVDSLGLRTANLTRKYLNFSNRKSYSIILQPNKKPFDNWKSAIRAFGETEHQWLKSKRLPINSVGFTRGKERQASPLWLRVLPVQLSDSTTRFILLAVLFDVDFDSKGSNYQAVKKFLESANFEVPQ